MSEKHFAAIDLGATSGRVILGTTDGGILRSEEIHRFTNPITEVSGHCYWDLLAIYREIIEGLRLIARRDIALTSVGIDTWGVDFAAFGRDGELLRAPYCYRDLQTEGAPEIFFKRLPREELYRRTGIQIMDFNTLFQFDTLRRNGSSLFAAAEKFLFIPDALSYLLTGVAVTEYTIASTSQLLDPHTRRWDETLLGLLGLRAEHFGRPVMPGERIGTLTRAVQQLTGLGPVEVVAVAGHDTASAVAAVPAEAPHFAYLSSGTWSLMGVESAEPVVTQESFRLNFTNEGGVGGTIRLLKNICGMWLLERCRAEWPATSYPELIAAAERSTPFASLINPDSPCFANPASMTAAIDTYCKKTGQQVPADVGAYVRCIFESLALRYRQVIGMLRTLSPVRIDRLYVIGGGARNEALNRMTADATGIPVVTGSAESTALGNLLLQARTAGIVADTPSMRAMVRRSLGNMQTFRPSGDACWDEAYARYQRLYAEI